MGSRQPPKNEDSRVSELLSPLVAEPWQHVSPVLEGARVTLRELHRSDAGALLAAISTNDLVRMASPPPESVAAFERFIAQAHQQRAIGEAICFGVLTAGYTAPVGLFQVRRAEPQFAVAEWAFALGSEFWGEGLFQAAAPLVVDWVFATLGVERLECRAAITNARVNTALQMIGAVPEAVLLKSLHRGENLDQLLWAVTAERWRALHPATTGRHVH